MHAIAGMSSKFCQNCLHLDLFVPHAAASDHGELFTLLYALTSAVNDYPVAVRECQHGCISMGLFSVSTHRLYLLPTVPFQELSSTVSDRWRVGCTY